MAFYKKVSKIGLEKNWLRFWISLGCQVRNDMKTLGNRSLGSDLNFLKNVKIESGQNLVTLRGQFSGTCAESPENAQEPILGSRSALFEQMSKLSPEKS